MRPWQIVISEYSGNKICICGPEDEMREVLKNFQESKRDMEDDSILSIVGHYNNIPKDQSQVLIKINAIASIQLVEL